MSFPRSLLITENIVRWASTNFYEEKKLIELGSVDAKQLLITECMR